MDKIKFICIYILYIYYICYNFSLIQKNNQNFNKINVIVNNCYHNKKELCITNKWKFCITIKKSKYTYITSKLS